MFFELIYTPRADRELTQIQKSPSKKGLYNQLQKILGYLQLNPRHPSLKTHPFTSLENPHDNDGKVFEAYVQNNTPGAYRVFWCYGPNKSQITILAITPHP